MLRKLYVLAKTEIQTGSNKDKLNKENYVVDLAKERKRKEKEHTGLLELPPVKVEQITRSTASEPEKQIVGTCSTTNGTFHGGPILPTAGRSHHTCADNIAGYATESKLDLATATTRSNTSAERLGAAITTEANSLDLDVVPVIDRGDIEATFAAGLTFNTLRPSNSLCLLAHQWIERLELGRALLGHAYLGD